MIIVDKFKILLYVCIYVCIAVYCSVQLREMLETFVVKLLGSLAVTAHLITNALKST